MQYLGAPWVPISSPSPEPELLKRIRHCYQPGGSSHTYPFLFSPETLWFRGIMMMPEFPRRFMNNQDPEVGAFLPSRISHSTAWHSWAWSWEKCPAAVILLYQNYRLFFCLSRLSVMFITIIVYFVVGVVGVGWIYKDVNWLRV